MTDYPVLPFGGRTHPNSGHAGSDTSRQRATVQDSDGTTAWRQIATLRALGNTRERGLTWRELSIYNDGSLQLDMHHGQSSGVLSGLHKAGKIARLSEVRGRCKVYVRPEFVGGRATEPYGETAKTAMLDGLARTLRFLFDAHDCGHSPHVWPECPACEAREMLKRYEVMKGGV